MNGPEEKEEINEEHHGLVDRISGFGQKVIGEIETLGGVLTADPMTQAEGEFNLEVGDLREEIEEDLEETAEPDREEGEGRE
ncbi:MAG: hypothetical protein AB7Q37_16475 [Pyrinomonadaceae bacterium]